MIHTERTMTERYPCGFSDSIEDDIREAIAFGVLPDLTISEFEAELAIMPGFEREGYIQRIWDRL
jgi:hypothetical protein